MRTTYRALASLVLPFALAGCPGDDDGSSDGTADAGPTIDGAPTPDAPPPDAGLAPVLPETPPGTPPDGDPNVTLVTFNVALIDPGVVKAPVERRPLIINALKASDADVVCIQESFETAFNSKKQLADDLAAEYPHSFWTETGNTVLKNGVLILSKHPLYRGRELHLDGGTDIVDRNVIAANVLMDDAYFTVMCTHMSAGLDGPSVTKKSAQIDAMVAWATSEGYLDGPTFLLGDFNFGPDPTDEGTCPANPDCCLPMGMPYPCTYEPDMTNYDKVKMTFADPNGGAAFATSSRSVFIPLQVLTIYNNEPSQRIDHCLTRNIGTSVLTEGGVVFDEDINLSYNGPGAPMGGETLHTLSDHLGVRCKFVVD